MSSSKAGGRLIPAPWSPKLLLDTTLYKKSQTTPAGIPSFFRLAYLARICFHVFQIHALSLLASPDEILADLMGKVVRVQADTDQEEAAQLLQERDLLALPVVDREDRLVGVITIDDAIDILEEEATEDILDKASLASYGNLETVRSHRLVGGSLWDIWRIRLPFLLITLVGGLTAGMVMGNFEETLETITAVAFFIPLIMDMGGNLGTQSSSIFTRAFVLGHINVKAFSRHLLKEISVGSKHWYSVGMHGRYCGHPVAGHARIGVGGRLGPGSYLHFSVGAGFLHPMGAREGGAGSNGRFRSHHHDHQGHHGFDDLLLLNQPHYWHHVRQGPGEG